MAFSTIQSDLRKSLQKLNLQLNIVYNFSSIFPATKIVEFG